MTPTPRLSVLFVLLLFAAGPAGADDGDLQSEGREAIAPRRTVDVQHLALDLTVDVKDRSIAGSATLTVAPLRPGVRELELQQVALDVSAVTVAGAAAPFRLNGDAMFIELPAPPAGEAFDVVVTYAARPTNGLHFRGPGRDSPDDYFEVWSQGEDTDHRHWFPLFNHPSDRFTYEGRFTVEDPFKAASNGRLVGTEPSGRTGWSTWHYRLDQTLVGYLPALAVAPYEVFTETWGDVPLETWAPPGTDEAMVRRTTGRTAAMMDVFAELTGVPYPYPVYRQIYVQRFMYGGMENTTATIMDRDQLVPAHLAELDTRAETVVAHELAHQWYGDQLTCQNWREMWLNEGFATFFSALWGEREHGPEWYAGRIAGMSGGVRSADGRALKPLVPRFFANPGGRANPYAKGATVLHSLRVLLGDDAFFAAIADYTRTHQHGLVETEDLRRAMEAQWGGDLDWFFDQWVYLAGHPELKVQHAVDAEAGRVRVSIEQTQEVGGIVPRFVLPIDVLIVTSTGSTTDRLWLEETSIAASWELDGELLYVAIDPRGGLHAEIDHPRLAGELVAQLGSEHPAVVLSALSALTEQVGGVGDAERAAVTAMLKDATAPRTIRERAAAALGAWRDDASVATLLEVLEAERDGSAAVRQAVVGALGQGVARDEVVAALGRVLSRDPAEPVRVRALRSLGALLEEGVRPRALSLLQRGPTWNRLVERAAADELGRWGEASDLGALARFRGPEVDRRLRHAALWASARVAGREDVGRERDEARDPVARDAERALLDPDIRTRQTGIAVLGEAGDARSIEALEALRRTEHEPALIRQAERAIDGIRKRKDVDPDPTEAELEARLKRMEERLEAAESELKELQERR